MQQAEQIQPSILFVRKNVLDIVFSIPYNVTIITL